MTNQAAPSSPTDGANPDRRTANIRWCTEHDVAPLFDVDCFRCPYDNSVVGPVVRT